MALVFPDCSRDWILDTVSDIFVAGQFQACLYQNNNFMPCNRTTLSWFVECDFDGYARQPITVFTDDSNVFWDEEQVGFNAVTFEYVYSGAGVGNTAYGYWLQYAPLMSSDFQLIACEEFFRPVELIVDDNSVSFSPKFRLANLTWE